MTEWKKMNTSNTTSSIEHLVAETLDCPAKEFGGEFKTVGDLASPEKFLYWQFPDWKFDNKTVMVPPAYMPSELGYTISKDGKYGREDDVNVRGIQGEKLVYDRLQQVGRAKNMGMFVIHGFKLKDICSWNERCEKESRESVVPTSKIPARTGESDFIIFHHQKGVILIEVKNLKESDPDFVESADYLPTENLEEDTQLKSAGGSLKNERVEQIVQKSTDALLISQEDGDQIAKQKLPQQILKESTKSSEAAGCSNEGKEENSDFVVSQTDQRSAHTEVRYKEEGSFKKDAEIYKAKDQLDRSRKVVEAFAVTNSSNEQSDDLDPPFPVIMLIALPSTKKGTRHALIDDTTFIYKEDLRSPESFSKWWNDNIETCPSIATTLETTKVYELSLSRMLAVRHLGPVTESEYTANTSYTLDSFKHMENLAGRFRRIKEIEHPHLFRWCKDMSQVEHPASKVSKTEAFGALKNVNITAAEANLIKALNKHLSDKTFFRGHEAAAEDAKVFQYLSQVYIMDIDSIVRFMNRVTEARKEPVMLTADRTLKDFRLDETEDVSLLNELSKLLDRNQTGFLVGEYCTNLDVELCDNLAKGSIRVLPLTGKRPWAPVFTLEQLAVFEGPKKQLIIGGPGSGKTELMKAKALTLSQQSKGQEKILYLIQLPDKTKAVFPNVMAKFFKDNKVKNVDVMTIQLEGENYEVFERQCSQLRLEEYSHVFIDELWLGSKIRYQMQEDNTINVVDELKIVKQAIDSIKGYVWMSSVFDFKEQCFEEISDEEIRQVLASKRLEGKESMFYRTLGTPSLLETLKRIGGVTRRIKHLLRSANNIVKLLQDYSSLYLERDFPYGTENMLNHNVEGQDISWIAVLPQSHMDSSQEHMIPKMEQLQVQADELAMLTYSKCGEVIDEVTRFNPDLRPPSLMKSSKTQVKLQLCPDDILVVNFVARYQSKLNLGGELKRKGIPIYDLIHEQETFLNDFLDRSRGGVCLLNSRTRNDSTCLDGAEWPMVIVLLTSELMLNEGNARLETVRNYDPYIAMFRAQAKLVVISDSWRSSQDFLESVGKKSR